MTTIVVVRKDGIAAIAADTLTKWGTGKESAKYIANNDKLVHAGDTWIGAAGSATFKTGEPEMMEIIAGSCRVTLAGAEPRVYRAGESFKVAANSAFDIEALETLDYVCHFG